MEKRDFDYFNKVNELLMIVKHPPIQHPQKLEDDINLYFIHFYKLSKENFEKNDLKKKLKQVTSFYNKIRKFELDIDKELLTNAGVLSKSDTSKVCNYTKKIKEIFEKNIQENIPQKNKTKSNHDLRQFNKRKNVKPVEDFILNLFELHSKYFSPKSSKGKDLRDFALKKSHFTHYVLEFYGVSTKGYYERDRRESSLNWSRLSRSALTFTRKNMNI